MAAPTEPKLADDFASTMQQLVAQAERVTEPDAQLAGNKNSATAQLKKELDSMTARMAALERAIAQGFEKLTTAEQPRNISAQLQRLDEQMVALRQTESVNQRLFNSLHQELKSYRDNFLRESLQKPFIRDLVMLFDDLSTISAGLAASAAGQGTQLSANLENATHALLEILHRMEVNEIEPKDKVDRTYHRVVSYEPASFLEEDGQIVMRVKRGFVWRDQVLRPEEVVAKRYS